MSAASLILPNNNLTGCYFQTNWSSPVHIRNRSDSHPLISGGIESGFWPAWPPPCLYRLSASLHYITFWEYFYPPPQKKLTTFSGETHFKEKNFYLTLFKYNSTLSGRVSTLRADERVLKGQKVAAITSDSLTLPAGTAGCAPIIPHLLSPASLTDPSSSPVCFWSPPRGGYMLGYNGQKWSSQITVLWCLK